MFIKTIIHIKLFKKIHVATQEKLPIQKYGVATYLITIKHQARSQSYPHSLLSWLIWSTTTLSWGGKSEAADAPSSAPPARTAAISRTQSVKESIIRRYMSVSVCSRLKKYIKWCHLHICYDATVGSDISKRFQIFLLTSISVSSGSSGASNVINPSKLGGEVP